MLKEPLCGRSTIQHFTTLSETCTLRSVRGLHVAPELVQLLELRACTQNVLTDRAHKIS